jgi:hypothetical protein
MSVYRGAGGSGDATNDATVTAVQAAATSAATSATNAANSATAAANSATGAATSATNASNSATTAAGQATTAAGHATNASTFATNSSLSADDSADSATEAEGYASEAFDYKVAAASSASSASTSATNAAASSATATTAVNNALSLYGDAAALDAAVTAAQLAETNAETAETNAETAATTATNAASTATTQATNAAASAVAADADATSASIDANEAQAAATAAQAAVSSATAIYGSIADIQQAEANSEANRNAAAASATSASNSASTATTQAGIATTQATNAATSAAQASAVALGNEPVRHSVRPSLLLDFANTKTLDPRITFTRASTGTYYDGKTVAKAEENFLTQSEALDNGASWVVSGSTITANSTAAPDGATTADTITETITTAGHVVRTNNLAFVTAATDYAFSVYLKAGTSNFAYLTFSADGTGSTYFGSVFDLTGGGTVSQTYSLNGTLVSSAITSVGNGWYRCQVIGRLNAVASVRAYIGIAPTGTGNTLNSVGAISYLGTGATVFAWGVQLEQRSSVTAYTATTTAAITNYIPALQTAAAGVARFEHNPVTGESLGLEIEEQRTNLTNYSEQFDNAYWTKTNLSIEANSIVAPDGTLTGEKISPTTTSGVHKVARTISTSTGVAHTATIYAKQGGYSRIQISEPGWTGAVALFDTSSGTVVSSGSGGTGTITSVGNGWYRCSLSLTSGGTSIFFEVNVISGTNTSFAGDGFSGVYIWGAQLEAGGFATSYIPTVASQVTRSADAASMTGTNFSSWYRNEEGMLYGEAQIANLLSNNRGIAQLDNGSNDNHIRIAYSNADGGFLSGFRLNAGTAFRPSTLTGTANAPIKLSITYKTADIASSINAGTVGTSTQQFPMSLTTLRIGSLQGGFELNGTIKKLAYYPKRLTNAELQGLTTV